MLENIPHRDTVDLRAAINWEFQTGRVVLLDGWVVSGTENRLIKEHDYSIPTIRDAVGTCVTPESRFGGWISIFK
ncbi:hypothetical protein ACFL1S_08780 [Pseudomonadota bacterium]